MKTSLDTSKELLHNTSHRAYNYSNNLFGNARAYSTDSKSNNNLGGDNKSENVDISDPTPANINPTPSNSNNLDNNNNNINPTPS